MSRKHQSTLQSPEAYRDNHTHSPDQEDQSVKVQQKHPLCALESKIPQSMENPSKLSEYDGKENPYVLVQLINERLNYFNTDEASKCKLFALTLIRSARLWFNSLPDENIQSLTDFSKRFFEHFTFEKRQVVARATLNGIVSDLLVLAVTIRGGF